MIIKCKMCGGDIDFIPGATYGTREYCGSTSTIPQAEDENKLNRYKRESLPAAVRVRQGGCGVRENSGAGRHGCRGALGRGHQPIRH